MTDQMNTAGFVEVKTSDLIDEALDWAVAMCEGYDCQFDDEVTGPWLIPQEGYLHDEKPLTRYIPSTDWSQGGPIIDREKLDMYYQHDLQWVAAPQRGIEYIGPTPLIAAMRCYVASKIGDTVEIPKELTK